MMNRHSEQGASLVEVLVALLVTAVGTLTVATLMAYGTRLQVTSRNTTLATSVGRQTIEWLRVMPPLATQRAIGGSLTADTANYFRTVTTQGGVFRCRWQVTAGPAGTKQIQMVVLQGNATFPTAELAVEVWP